MNIEKTENLKSSQTKESLSDIGQEMINKSTKKKLVRKTSNKKKKNLSIKRKIKRSRSKRSSLNMHKKGKNDKRETKNAIQETSFDDTSQVSEKFNVSKSLLLPNESLNKVQEPLLESLDEKLFSLHGYDNEVQRLQQNPQYMNVDNQNLRIDGAVKTQVEYNKDAQEQDVIREKLKFENDNNKQNNQLITNSSVNLVTDSSSVENKDVHVEQEKSETKNDDIYPSKQSDKLQTIIEMTDESSNTNLNKETIKIKRKEKSLNRKNSNSDNSQNILQQTSNNADVTRKSKQTTKWKSKIAKLQRSRKYLLITLISVSVLSLVIIVVLIELTSLYSNIANSTKSNSTTVITTTTRTTIV